MVSTKAPAPAVHTVHPTFKVMIFDGECDFYANTCKMNRDKHLECMFEIATYLVCLEKELVLDYTLDYIPKTTMQRQ